jgi:hypothetical protein
MRTIQRPAIDPDFVFDMSQAATDQRLVTRIGEIRTAVDDCGIDPARRDLVVGVVQLLAFVGATPDQAVRAALDLADQLMGCEVEVHHEIGDLRIEIIAGEPADELTDQTIVEIDGDPLISILNQRERLVETDVDWDALDRLAVRTLLAFG